MYSIEEALEVLDVTPEECIEILLKHGKCALPPFIEDEFQEPSEVEYEE